MLDEQNLHQSDIINHHIDDPISYIQEHTKGYTGRQLDYGENAKDLMEYIGDCLDILLEERGHLLYPEQRETITNIRDDVRKWHLEGLMKLPTGCGKTRVFLEIIKATGLGGIVLVPKLSILDGIKEEALGSENKDKPWLGFDPEHVHLMGGKHSKKTAVQTAEDLVKEYHGKQFSGLIILTYNSFLRIKKEKPVLARVFMNMARVIVTDESHRSIGENTHEALDSTLHAHKNELSSGEIQDEDYSVDENTSTPSVEETVDEFIKELTGLHPHLHLRPTATPKMTKGKDVRNQCEHTYICITAEESFNRGTLMCPNHATVPKATALAKLPENNAYLSEDILNQLADADKFTNSEWPLRVSLTNKYLELKEKHKGYLPAVGFCRTIEQAELITNYMQDQWIRAVRVTSGNDEYEPGMPVDEATKMFRNNEIDIMITVAQVSEGYNLPTLRTSIWFFPTESAMKSIQGNGRIARRFNGNHLLPAKTPEDIYIIEAEFYEVRREVGDIYGNDRTGNDFPPSSNEDYEIIGTIKGSFDILLDAGEISHDFLKNKHIHINENLLRRFLDENNEIEIDGEKYVALWYTSTIYRNVSISKIQRFFGEKYGTWSEENMRYGTFIPHPNSGTSSVFHYVCKKEVIDTLIDEHALGRKLTIEEKIKQCYDILQNPERQKILQEQAGVIIDDGVWYLHRAKTMKLIKKSILGNKFFSTDICHAVLGEGKRGCFSIKDFRVCLEYIGIQVWNDKQGRYYELQKPEKQKILQEQAGVIIDDGVWYLHRVKTMKLIKKSILGASFFGKDMCHKVLDGKSSWRTIEDFKTCLEYIGIQVADNKQGFYNELQSTERQKILQEQAGVIIDENGVWYFYLVQLGQLIKSSILGKTFFGSDICRTALGSNKDKSNSLEDFKTCLEYIGISLATEEQEQERLLQEEKERCYNELQSTERQKILQEQAGVIIDDGVWYLHRAKTTQFIKTSILGASFFGSDICHKVLDGKSSWGTIEDFRACLEYVGIPLATEEQEQERLLQEKKEECYNELQKPEKQKTLQEQAGVIIDDGVWYLHRVDSNKIRKASILGASFFGSDMCHKVLGGKSSWGTIEDFKTCLEYIGISLATEEQEQERLLQEEKERCYNELQSTERQKILQEQAGVIIDENGVWYLHRVESAKIRKASIFGTSFFSKDMCHKVLGGKSSWGTIEDFKTCLEYIGIQVADNKQGFYNELQSTERQKILQEQAGVIIDDGVWYLHRVTSRQLQKASILGASFFGSDICRIVLGSNKGSRASLEDFKTCLEYIGISLATKEQEQEKLLQEEKERCYNELQSTERQKILQEQAGVIIDENGVWYLHRVTFRQLQKASILGASFFGRDICRKILIEKKCEWGSIEDFKTCLEYIGISLATEEQEQEKLLQEEKNRCYTILQSPQKQKTLQEQAGVIIDDGVWYFCLAQPDQLVKVSVLGTSFFGSDICRIVLGSNKGSCASLEDFRVCVEHIGISVATKEQEQEKLLQEEKERCYNELQKPERQKILQEQAGVIIDDGVWYLHRAKSTKLRKASIFGTSFFGKDMCHKVLGGKSSWGTIEDFKTCLEYIGISLATEEQEQERLLQEEKDRCYNELQDPERQKILQEQAGVIIDDGVWYLHRASTEKLKEISILGSSFFGIAICRAVLEGKRDCTSVESFSACLKYIGIKIVD